MGIRAIAKQIGRDFGVVCREVQRNTTGGGYTVVVAKKLTEQRAKHIKPRKLDKDLPLRAFVMHWIREGLWKTTTRDNGTENVLHENTRKQYGVKSYFCDTYSSW